MKANAILEIETTEAWIGCVSTVHDTDVKPCNKIQLVGMEQK